MSKKTKEVKLNQNISWYKNTTQLGVVIAILVVTNICFLPALDSKKEFTNWDDGGYVINQPLIKNLSSENIKTLFNPRTEVMLNYHPITMITLALNYKFSELNIKDYIYTNIFIHLLNVFLVFSFIYSLSRKKFWVATLSALWFGVHPMHVESVAWIAERKDVMYCFFFLLSCITYLRYLETKKIIHLAAVFVLFVLSCLSKAMAVPLPLILILIDYYYHRKIDLKTIAEKIPLLIFAILIGYNATIIQATEAIADYKIFTTLQRLMFASYGFMMYWAKLILPINLSAFYPYPTLDKHGGIPLIFNIAPIIALAIVFVPGIIFYKMKNSEWLRIYVFGMGFFALMVALVLQFMSVGSAVMADRYSYLPYIGAFFMLAMFANIYLENKKTRTIAISILAIFSIMFTTNCYNRVKIWENNETLWTDVIEKYPMKISQTGNVVQVEEKGVEVAYKNRGNYYREKGLLDKAFEDYNILARSASTDPGVYSNLGNVYAMRKDFKKSLEMYSKSISLKPNNFEAIMNRGITFSAMGKHQDALNDFVEALKIDPSAQNLFLNIASEKLNLKMYNECISDCNNIVAKNPNESNAYFYRGTAFINMGKTNEAIADLQKTVAIAPNNANAWFNLSFTLNQTGNYKAALETAQKAQALNFAIDPIYINGLIEKNK